MEQAAETKARSRKLPYVIILIFIIAVLLFFLLFNHGKEAKIAELEKVLVAEKANPDVLIINAVTENRVEYCEDIDDLKIREKCRINFFITKALEKEDVSLCEELREDYAHECKYEVIVKKAMFNPSLCNELEGDYRKRCILSTDMYGGGPI